MIVTTFGQDKKVAKFIEEVVGIPGPRKKYVCIGVEKEGELIAGAQFFNYFPTHSIEVNFASTTPEWLNPRILKIMANYPFNRLKIQIVYVYIAARNKRAVKFVKRLGFKQDGMIRKFYNFGEDDAVVLSMLRDECNWIGDTDEK